MVSASLRTLVFAACLFNDVLAGRAGKMNIVGHSGVSSQMMFLGSENKVYILDKAENNAMQIDGHPAYASVYDISNNKVKAMHAHSNPFCAGGAVMGDGRYIVTGGNKAVQAGGADATPLTAPYYDANGGRSIRLLSPMKKNETPKWRESAHNKMNVERWYNTIEPLADGSVAILGGMRDGGFVVSQYSNEPTFEFYPDKGRGTKYVDFLARTVPLALYPITYLMSDGRLFMQANRETILLKTSDASEEKLPNIPHAPRVYPASGGSALLPLTPANGYTETILFCGGMDMTDEQWGNEGGPTIAVSERKTSTSCTQIRPLDKNPQWHRVDALPEGRSMGQFIQLPNGELWFGNGVTTGVAGYTNDPNAVGKPVGQSYGDNPSYHPLVYNPKASLGKRWRRVGKANVGRLYHSSATLLPDSSILVSGSNPNPDVTSQHWGTSYSVERWYPEYFDDTRPSSRGLPTQFHYGGSEFQLKFSSSSKASKAKVVLIRTGFSTHAMNMGQRMIELDTRTQGSTLRVAQLPPNPRLFAPGPALAFVVVDGVPSIGKFVMVGTGKIETQPTHPKTSFKSSKRVASEPDPDADAPVDTEDDAEEQKRSEPSDELIEALLQRAAEEDAEERRANAENQSAEKIARDHHIHHRHVADSVF